MEAARAGFMVGVGGGGEHKHVLGYGKRNLGRKRELRGWSGNRGKNLLLPTPLLGGSGGVVNSLDFCLASLKSLGCF